MNKIVTNPKTRKYIYGVSAAAIPVAVAVGIITEEQAVTVGSSVLGLLAVVLALPNTPDDDLKPQGYEQGM